MLTIDQGPFALNANGNQRHKTKGPHFREGLILCRDDWIRTSDPLHPMQVRYRAALRPVICRAAVKVLCSNWVGPVPVSVQWSFFETGCKNRW